MAYIFQTRTDGLGHARNAQALRNGQAAFETAPDLPGDTDPDGGECAVMLHDLPVLVRYELTFDGCDEIAEVNEVSIGGHTIPAAYFDADTRRVWASECMQARGGL